MTLHWWMHWFWVTMLLTLLASIQSHAAPQSDELHHMTPETEVDRKPFERQGRAMYYTKTTLYPTTKPNVTNTTEKEQESLEQDLEITKNITATNATEIVHPSILWTHVNFTDTVDNTLTETKNITTTTAATITTTSTTVTPTTEPPADNNTSITKKPNFTRPEVVKDETAIEGISDSRIVTEKPLSLETTFLQTRIPPNVESSRRVIDGNDGGMDTGAIAGISFAALVLTALAGSTAFVLYRRRYLNKPQTLNDKCSNPDSSGYLDDSTIRDNSEEMYSLDNDSFLNSLEAMTIQNYWTDTVKHTKL